MSEDASDVREGAHAWVVRRFGVPRLIVMVGVIGVVSPWTQWQDVSQRPESSAIIGRFSGKNVSTADPERFGILVTRFDRDPDDMFGNLIVDGIKEVPAIQAAFAVRVRLENRRWGLAVVGAS